MSDYNVGVSAYLFNAAGDPVGMLGRDGREWLFPATVTSLGNAGADLRECAVLFDRVTGAPVGYLTPSGQEYLFPAPLTFNSATRGLTISAASETMLGAVPQGIGSTRGGWSWPAPLIGPGGSAMPSTLSAAIALAEAGFSHTGTGDITTSLVSNRAYESNTGVAPYGVQFDATGTTTALTANPFRDLLYVMHFGDDDSAVWNYGTRAGVAKRNLARGAVSAHVFETPGTKTVKCTPMYLSSGGVLSVGATQSITITVQDPDVVFAGTNTICIANGTTPVPGVNGVPAGADCRNITTHAGIISVINANPQKRILMKRGDSWNVVSAGSISANGPGIIGAYGTGAKPVFPCTTAAACFTSSTANGCTDWRIMDLAYNATALATGAARNSTRFWSHGEGTGATAGKFGLLLRCESENAGTFAQVNADTVVADCNVPQVDGGTGNNALYCGKVDRIAVLGLNAPNATAAEHCMRLQGTRYSVVSNCTLKNPATAKHALTLRGFSTGGVWEGIYTEYVCISDSVFESVTDQTVTISSINVSTDERFREIVFERNYTKNTQSYGVNFLIKGGNGFAIRNNLYELSQRGTAVALERSWISASIPLTDVTVHNSTIYSSLSAAQLIAGVSCAHAEVTGVDIRNIVMYAPLHTGPKKVVNFTAGSYTESNNTPDANIASVSPQFLATPPTTFAEWKPGSGSYANNGGAWVPVFDDFFGAAREGTPDMGAVIPS